MKYTDSKTNTLSDKALEALRKKPPTKDYDLTEKRGFGVRVRTTGKVTFFYRYLFEGRRRFLNLGDFPDTTTDTARAFHGIAYAQVKQKIDPMEKKVATPEPVQQTSIPLKDMADLYLTDWAAINYSARTCRNHTYLFNGVILPALGDRPLDSIKRKEVIALLQGIAAGDNPRPQQAENVRKALAKMFWYARQLEYIELSPCDRIHEVLPMLRSGEGVERALSDQEIFKLWRRISKGTADPATKRALLFVLVTGQRPGEVVGMHRREIKGSWWTIPWQRRKTECSKTLRRKPRDHRVFLTPLALSLIGDSKGFIFSTDDGRHPLTENALNQHVRRGTSRRGRTFPCYALEPWTPHDLRRTVKTGMSRIGIDSNHSEHVLGHYMGRIKSTYDRHEYDAEKQAALEKWSAHLERLVYGNA